MWLASTSVWRTARGEGPTRLTVGATWEEEGMLDVGPPDAEGCKSSATEVEALDAHTALLCALAATHRRTTLQTR